TASGQTLSTSVYEFPRWKAGKYCYPVHNQFRQHPKDHLEVLESTTRAVVQQGSVDPRQVRGIGIDTTGSSPMAGDDNGRALALQEEFAENTNAMPIIWKDHTAIKQAEEINQLARSWRGIAFTPYSGGIYSSEWFWSKILHTIRP